MGPRSLWKRPFVCPLLIQEITQMFLAGYPQTHPFITDSRRTTIIPEFIGLRFEVSVLIYAYQHFGTPHRFSLFS